jgi:PucR-like helix-turn-helix protein
VTGRPGEPRGSRDGRGDPAGHDGPVNELAIRLAALDPDASAAVRVITYFDSLVEARAGLSAIVRGAAVLAGCPARLVDDARHLAVRVEADGSARPAPGDADPAWPSRPVPHGGAVLHLERSGAPGGVDAMVLERAAAAAAAVLDRTRGRPAPDGEDPASAELLLDATAPAHDRLEAARRLRLGETARAVASADGGARIVPAAGPFPQEQRAGIGPAVPVLELPASWAAARTALRFTAAGTDNDPGPRVVHAEELGGLVLLAAAVGPGSEPVDDVRALQAAAASAPWQLATLDAVATAGSVRTAAAALRVHHSTLQDRVLAAEHILGWNVREPQGRLRLQLALVLRRLHASAG